LGWLGVILGAFPIDLWVPEAFVPYSLYANPHFPLAMALTLVIFEQVVWGTRNLPPILWAGLAALALAMMLPFALLTVWAILMVFLGWCYVTTRRLPWRQIWPTLGVILLPAPVIFYQYWVSATNPILTGWSMQNITTAPKVLDVLLGYGLVGLLAVGGGWLIIRQGFKQEPAAGEWLVLLWAVTTVVLVYFPFDLQRRLITGLHLPLCILAAIGLARWLTSTKLKPGYRRLITMAVVVIGALGTAFVWSLPLIGALQSPTESATTALLFMRQEEKAAFNWLGEHIEPDDVVLASSRVGMFIPGQTGARAFYGHPFETIEAKSKRAQVEAFYGGETETVSPPADFIFYGPSEQSLGQPEKLSDLRVVFSLGEVVVYLAK
jgi:hypothetical protein